MWTIMYSRWSGVLGAAAVLACLPLSVRGQFVQDVNGLRELTYIFDCCPSDLTVTDNFPTLAKFDEQFTGAQSGADFANRHEFLFSSNGGTSARIFNNDDSFDVAVDVKLEAGFNIPRKEAGLRANRSFQDGRFIVTTNEGALETGEIVAFGGPFPFFSFDDEFGIRYTPGTTISLRMIYNEPTAPGCLDNADNCGTMEYLADYMDNHYTSGPLKFTNLEGGIVNGNVVGTYMQATPSTSNPTADFGISTFTNFEFGIGETDLEGDFNFDGVVDAADYVALRKNNLPQTDYDKFFQHFGETQSGSGGAAGVPEPSAAALVVLAGLGVFWRNRRD